MGVVGQANDGTIKGRLIWGGDNVPPVVDLVAKGKAQKDPNVCAKNSAIRSHELEVDPKTKGVAYGFAYLSRPKASNPALVAGADRQDAESRDGPEELRLPAAFGGASIRTRPWS